MTGPYDIAGVDARDAERQDRIDRERLTTTGQSSSLFSRNHRSSIDPIPQGEPWHIGSHAVCFLVQPACLVEYRYVCFPFSHACRFEVLVDAFPQSVLVTVHLLELTTT